MTVVVVVPVGLGNEQQDTRTVAGRLAELRNQIRALSSTSCAGCGHAYRNHQPWRGGKCGTARYGDTPSDCKCRAFVDAPEVLA